MSTAKNRRRRLVPAVTVPGRGRELDELRRRARRRDHRPGRGNVKRAAIAADARESTR